MATLTYTSRTQHAPSLLESLRNGISAFFHGIQDGMDMADRYHALSRMSDEQLAKKGLTRGNITRAVVLGTRRA
jgi:uncharacterized protein YjiS (DUF1127 family)